MTTMMKAQRMMRPIHTHHRLAREALLAGKHVLVEKPLATSVADAVELIDLARRRHLVLSVPREPVFRSCNLAAGRYAPSGN